MDSTFWHERWKQNEIGFHQKDYNPLLVSHFKQLNLEQGARVFLPLCGKTLDIRWLLENQYRVVGIELSKIAIEQLFDELGLKPEISELDKLQHYRTEYLDIFVGDYFDLSTSILGHVNAVYDRAALIALPEAMRQRYTEHLINITKTRPQMLITIDYDPTQIEGPPFLVSDDEVIRHYSNHYQVSKVTSIESPDKLKGKCVAIEKLWLLE